MPELPRQDMATVPDSSRCTVQRSGRISPQCRTPSGGSSGPGSGNRGSGRAGSAAGITGSTSRVPAGPSRSSAVAGDGVGQIIGHMALDTASRMRCPRGNTHEVTCSSSGSAPAAPPSAPSARLSAPAASPSPAAAPRPVAPGSRSGSGTPARPAPVTSVAVPSGATSLSRANQCSGAASALPDSSTRGKPRISRSQSSGAESNVRLHASASRWSPVSSPHQLPAAIPADGTYRSHRAEAGGASGDSDPSGPQNQVRNSARSGGSAFSCRHRPGISASSTSGGCQCRTYTVTGGSDMIPVSAPLSQWSHQRTASARHSMAGPGTALCG